MATPEKKPRKAFHMSRAGRVRAWPFMAFMALLALRGWVPADGSWGIDPRWIYGLTVVVVGGLLLAWRKEYTELAAPGWPDARQLGLSAAVGLLVFVAWIHLDAPWMTLGEAAASFVPLRADGSLDWTLVSLRVIGAALIVPLMEELFWRSFLMRWLQRPGFITVDPMQVGLRAVLLSTLLFVLVHPLWLAAALAGLAYAWLYVRTGKLWTSVIAHAVTNAALAAWVIHSRQWQFW
jgi:uncharacterized protein